MGRAYLFLAYSLYYKRKLRTTDRVRLFGFDLTILPGVFHPCFFLSTKAFGQYLLSQAWDDKSVLEMGSGSGILSLLVASRGGRVTSVDVNPAAVECTLINAVANHMTARMQVLQSDLFSGLSDHLTFDVILWNPPFYPRDPADMPERALNAGRAYEVIRRFIDHTRARLNPNGRILLVLKKDDIDATSILRLFTDRRFLAVPIYSKWTLFETMVIYEIR